MPHRFSGLSAWRPSFLILLSAMLMVVSFPPWNAEWPIWFFLAPWFWSISKRTSWHGAFRDGLWMSFFVTVFGFFWVCWVLHEFGAISWAAAIFLFLIFAFISQTQFLCTSLIFYWAWQRLQKRRISILSFALFFAFAYVGVDWFIPKLFTDTLGHAFYQSEALRQCADWVGAYGLTFMVLIVNLFFFLAYATKRAQTEPSWQPLIKTMVPLGVITLATILSAALYGSYRLKEVRAWMNSPSDRMQIAVIQANIGDFDKIAAERGVRGAADNVLQTYYRLSTEALNQTPKPETIVWPETAYPSLFRSPTSANELARDQALERYALIQQTPILFGGYDRTNNKDHNAFFYLSPKFGTEEVDLSVYRKHTLLLFGEYIPGAEQFEFIKRMFPQVGNFGRGAGPQVLEIPRLKKPAVKTGPLICYEVLFPQYVIDTVKLGAQVLTNITNDSWFGPHAEPELHLALSTFRAVETRVPLLRATNTGISSLVLPDGQIAKRSSLNQEEILNWEVPLYDSHPTGVMLWGDRFGLLALVIALLWAINQRRLKA